MFSESGRTGCSGSPGGGPGGGPVGGPVGGGNTFDESTARFLLPAKPILFLKLSQEIISK